LYFFSLSCWGYQFLIEALGVSGWLDDIATADCLAWDASSLMVGDDVWQVEVPVSGDAFPLSGDEDMC
jgi:hypothetical protein